MDEDPLPYKAFKKDFIQSSKLLLALLFWGLVFGGIFLIVGIVFAQFTLGGVLWKGDDNETGILHQMLRVLSSNRVLQGKSYSTKDGVRQMLWRMSWTEYAWFSRIVRDVPIYRASEKEKGMEQIMYICLICNTVKNCQINGVYLKCDECTGCGDPSEYTVKTIEAVFHMDCLGGEDD